MHTLATLLPALMDRNMGWLLFGLCVIAGIVVGRSDLARFSLKRVWAISGVCFDESIRRRVLWITPLAILGVIVVSQLQKPLDEQDAIRQTVKFCIFATGLLVAVTTIILACTNLPREIETRVIYTVVTKPTTRLEIVLGKVVGFARVSFMILLIMGIFSLGYLSLRAWSMRRQIEERLATPGAVAATSVASLKYYRDAGLLNAKTLEVPDGMDILARLPEESGTKRYFAGSGEGSIVVPFDIDPASITPKGATEPGAAGMMVVARIGYERTGAKAEVTVTTKPASTAPTALPYYGPFVMSPEERQAIMAGVRLSTNPEVSISLENADGSFGAPEPFGPVKRFELTNRGGLTELRGIIDPKTAKQMTGRNFIRITSSAPDTVYYVDLGQAEKPVELVAPRDERELVTISPAGEMQFQSRTGTFGLQLRGGEEKMPTAIFAFRDARVTPDRDNMVPFELRAGIERSGTDEIAETGSDLPTRVSVRIRNQADGKLSDEVIVEPESNRTIFFRLPASAVAGGNFDVLMKCLTGGDFLGIKAGSLVLITSSQPFALNLVKSLLILWLLTILITTVAIFTSTFLSWPIAVVLTLVILLGHWGVQQLGDAIAPGIGSQVVTDFGLKSPAKAEAVRATVEKLSSFLNLLSTILPDISRFAAVEEIERGIAIPTVRIRDALGVTFAFGLPMVMLAYIFLRNKEVAP